METSLKPNSQHVVYLSCMYNKTPFLHNTIFFSWSSCSIHFKSPHNKRGKHGSLWPHFYHTCRHRFYYDH